MTPPPTGRRAAPEMPRIGRHANPAERGLQYVRENADVLDHVARNLIAYTTGETSITVARSWDAMNETERDAWRERALTRLADETAQYVAPTDPDDPDPGASRPDEVHRVA